MSVNQKTSKTIQELKENKKGAEDNQRASSTPYKY